MRLAYHKRLMTDGPESRVVRESFGHIQRAKLSSNYPKIRTIHVDNNKGTVSGVIIIKLQVDLKREMACGAELT